MTIKIYKNMNIILVLKKISRIGKKWYRYDICQIDRKQNLVTYQIIYQSFEFK